MQNMQNMQNNVKNGNTGTFGENWGLALRTSFCCRTSRKKCELNDFRYQKNLLEYSKTMFWSCLNRSGKTNTNDGRTSKHSE